MKKYFSLLFLLIIIFSCSNRKSNDYSTEGKEITIDLKSVQNVSLKIENIRYIPLETTDECLIGRADKVLIKNNRIYVSDFNKAMALFVFDMNGKLLFKINRRGQGPGEYISFNDFDIQVNQDIFMLDHFGKKILVFDSEGKYLHSVNFEFFFRNFCLIENKIYLSHITPNSGKKVADLAVYDMENKKTKFLLEDEKFLYPIGFTSSRYKFYYSPNNTYYSPKLSETIFAVFRDSFAPAIVIKNLPVFPKNLLEGAITVNNPVLRSDFFERYNYFLENFHIYETDNYISMHYLIGLNSNELLYNKRTKMAYQPNSSYFIATGSSNIEGSTGIEFFSVVNFSSENKFQKQILTTREDLKNWKEEDNPVIVIFDFDM